MAEPWSAVPEWIHKADADWRAVEALIGDQSNSLHDVVVFHAQQAVEKLLKARLIQLGQDLQKIHDLAMGSRGIRGSFNRGCARALPRF